MENIVDVKAMLTEKSVSNCKQCVPHSVWLCFRYVCFCTCKNFDHNDIQIMLLNFCKLKVDALGLVLVGTCMVQSVPSQFVKRGKSLGASCLKSRSTYNIFYLFSFISLLIQILPNFQSNLLHKRNNNRGHGHRLGPGPGCALCCWSATHHVI